MHVGLAVPDGVIALGGCAMVGICPWVGAKDVDGAVFCVELVVPKGATVYAPTISLCTAATWCE